MLDPAVTLTAYVGDGEPTNTEDEILFAVGVGVASINLEGVTVAGTVVGDEIDEDEGKVMLRNQNFISKASVS